MTTGMIISVFAIFILILLSAFFSGSETALTAASRGRMHARAKEGDARAALVGDLREHKDRLIGALLLGKASQAKERGGSELTSMSGAGFMRSIA